MLLNVPYSFDIVDLNMVKVECGNHLGDAALACERNITEAGVGHHDLRHAISVVMFQDWANGKVRRGSSTKSDTSDRKRARSTVGEMPCLYSKVPVVLLHHAGAVCLVP